MSQAWTPDIADRFDHLAFRHAVCGSVVVGRLKGSDWAALWFAAAHADGLGQVDLPRAYMARQMGISDESAKRAARRLAGELGLLTKIRSRPGSPVARYQLTAPAAARAAAPGADEAGPIRLSSRQHPQWTGQESHDSGGSRMTPTQAGGGSPVTPWGGHARPGRGVTGDPQSRDKSRDKSSSSPRPRKPLRADGSVGLFERPCYDAAAAAVLISAGLSSRQTAQALVARHRVTREQARNVRANLRAAQRAGVTIHNAAGWVRAAVKLGEVMLDQRVLDDLDRRRVARRRRAQQAQQALFEKASQEREIEQARRREAAAVRYAAMRDDERNQLHARLTEGLLAQPPRHLLRNWAIDELSKKQPASNPERHPDVTD